MHNNVGHELNKLSIINVNIFMSKQQVQTALLKHQPNLSPDVSIHDLDCHLTLVLKDIHDQSRFVLSNNHYILTNYSLSDFICVNSGTN